MTSIQLNESVRIELNTIPEKFLEKNNKQVANCKSQVASMNATFSLATCKQVGCLYPYVETKKLKDGTEVLYPRIVGKRDRTNLHHWRWGFNWKEKHNNVWKGRSIGSIPCTAVPMIRTMQSSGCAIAQIIEFISKVKEKGIAQTFVPIPPSCPTKPILRDDSPIAVVLFAGGGGIEAGMVQSGIRPVIAVEFDPTKPELSSAIAQNHDLNFAEYGCKVIRQTVQEVAQSGFIDFPYQPDYLHASPVCSRFSKAYTAKAGIKGETSEDLTSAYAVTEAIRHLRPRVFTLENVSGYQNSESFSIILNTLECLGYIVNSDVINMAKRKLPQARERFFLIAGIGFRVPLPPASAKQVGWYSAIAHLIPTMKDSKLLPKQQQALNDFLANNAPAPLLIERVGGRGKVKCKPGHLPCYTIMRSHFTDDKGNNRNKFADIWLPDGTVKSLSIQGAAKLQGFPEWYEFPRDAATSGSIIGYSVPPSFATQLFGLQA